MIVVADTGPLNYLLLIGEVNVLPVLYSRLFVPRTVVEELKDPHTPPVVREWITRPPEWLTIKADPVTDGTLIALDPGERAAIALAQLLSADRLLIDDSGGRAEAERRGLGMTGTLGVLAAGHRAGLLDFDSALARLRETSFYLSPGLLETLRRSAKIVG